MGVLMDYFGDPIATMYAPTSGLVNYIPLTPPVSKGEPVAMILRPEKPDNPGAGGGSLF